MKALRSAIFIIFYTIYAQSVFASSFCGDYHDQESSRLSGDQTLADVCSAEIGSFNGTFAFIEKGFLPIPKYFYLKLPHENYISMDSSRMAGAELDWPYGVLIISGLERSRLQHASEVNEINHPVIQELRAACQMSIDVWRVRFEMPGNDYAPYFVEARLGETRISLAGEPPDLMLAMLDSFIRLNCTRP